ncbi:MAG: GNAT family N-acetyltransferase [Clostridia bacterium]|nr:GNAT family N-acetyltransferase [Clostridia bacterium]
MQFEPLTEQSLESLTPYFAQQTTRMSTYSGAYQFMWNRELFSPDYAIVGRCVVFKGRRGGKNYFFYPVSRGGNVDEELEAIEEIEKYCRKNYYKLQFTNVPEERVGLLCSRYASGMHVETVRTWYDYLYETKDFKTFAGKKFSGQRNHINKFYRTYPDAAFKIFQPGDEKKILDFLNEFEKTQFRKDDYMAVKELSMVKKLVPNFTRFNQCCGYMEAGGKIISVAAGEVCGDTLMQHVEKALRGYEGVYPATAQAFVRAFADEGVKYLNREDDAGDLGLRKSKLQYNPCGMVKKYTLEVDKPLKQVKTLPVIRSERLRIAKIHKRDKEAYFALASDVERNRWWGYDYRNDLKGKTPDADYFLNIIRRDFRQRNEMALGVFLDKTLIGEAVLHNFSYTGEAEVGARLLPEYEGKGYAREALKALTDYAFSVLAVERVQAKCFKENARSRRMLEGAGMRFCGEDETFYYFYRTAAT